MKTPEEIKRGLERCATDNCDNCPYVINWVCSYELKSDSLAYIQQLEAKVPKWISVEERLPEGICIAVNDMGSMIIGYIGEEKGSETGYSCEDEQYYMPSVTHWMPLPEPPEV